MSFMRASAIAHKLHITYMHEKETATNTRLEGSKFRFKRIDKIP